MKSLTRLWGDFKHVKLDKNKFCITTRLFFHKLTAPNNKEAPIYLSINTFSGSIDIFNEREGIFLDKLIKKNDFKDIPENFLLFLKSRGYLFPSKEVEDLIFDTIINKYKNLKYSSDKLFPLFAIDTSYPMQCEYCFEKKNHPQSDLFEKSIMDMDSLKAAFNAFELIQTLQQKDIELIGGWGGEPLQEKHSNINEDFITLAKNRGWKTGYFSNLALIGDNLSKILEKNVQNIKFIQTTLDSTFDKHNQYRKIPNAFDKTVNNINKLLKIGIPITIRTNIGPNNINNLPELATFYQNQGWFDFPNFKSFITKTFDRYHDQKTNFIFTEEDALSKWLKLKDEFPHIRNIETYKFVPSLYNILKALEIRESLDNIHDSFEINIKPMLTYCHLGNRTMYIFTGNPNYSIYNCAECVGISNYKIGKYYPTISLDPEKLKMWNIDENFFEIIMK